MSRRKNIDGNILAINYAFFSHSHTGSWLILSIIAQWGCMVSRYRGENMRIVIYGIVDCVKYTCFFFLLRQFVVNVHTKRTMWRDQFSMFNRWLKKPHFGREKDFFLFRCVQHFKTFFSLYRSTNLNSTTLSPKMKLMIAFQHLPNAAIFHFC